VIDDVAAVILAAGDSRRFGKPKQLLDWEGRPLVTHIVDTAWMAGFTHIAVVVGAEAEAVKAALHSRPVHLIHNYRWHQGLSSSVYAGVIALPARAEAAHFIPVDQPLLTPRLLRAFVTQWRASGKGIVVPVTPQGERGNPVLFARRYFEELASLSGDVGGRALLSRHPQEIAYLPVEVPWLLADVDTPDAYQRLQTLAQAQIDRLSGEAIEGIICDMDGVLWRARTPLPGLQRFFAWLHETEIPYILATNNSSRTPAQYVQKLADMGVETDVSHVLNSAVATAHYIATQQPEATVYAIGGTGVYQALQQAGLKLVTAEEVERVDYVVVGWDRKLTWDKLAHATRLIRAGGRFISTNPDRTFPMDDWLAPGNGAQISALETATDVHPITIGKPEPALYRQAMERMHSRPERTLVIGDRLDTDILGGLRLGMPTALMLTGVTERADLKRSPIRPTAVFDGLDALIATLGSTSDRR